MKCFFCGAESEWKNTTTSETTDYEGRLIIIKNIPCDECEGCGEKYFQDEVMERLEKLFDKAKNVFSENVQMDYSDDTDTIYRLEKRINCVAENTHIYGWGAYGTIF